MLIYADDMAVWADSPVKLQQLVSILEQRLAAGGLMLSGIKSCVMVTGGGTPQPTSITIGGETLKTVMEFKYLGTVITADNSDEEDVRRRVGWAWSMFFDLSQTLRARDVLRRLRTRIFYTSVLAILLHGCEHWRVTHRVATRLTKAHHGMLLSKLRLSRTRAAELHITRAEARAQTGAKDIMGLIERRWLRWGTKLMLMHRTAPSLPSIAFAGELFVADYVWPRCAYHEGGTWLQNDGRHGRPLHWAWQYRELLVRCLGQQGNFGPAELDTMSVNIIKRADYGEIEEVPLQVRAEAHVRCPHCNLLRNDQQDLVTHIDRCQSANNSRSDSSSDNRSSRNDRVYHNKNFLKKYFKELTNFKNKI